MEKTNSAGFRSNNIRLKDWRDFLKRDADHDFIYILRVLAYKLHRTRLCIETNDVIADTNKISRQIRSAEELILKVIEYDYEAEEERRVERRFGPRHLSYSHVPIEGTKYLRMITRCRWDKFKPSVRRKADKALRQGWIRADRRRRTDLKSSFDIILKSLWNWWD